MNNIRQHDSLYHRHSIDVNGLMYDYDFYFASPFFNDEQTEREEALKEILRGKGYRVFSPKELTFIPPKANLNQQKDCFVQNLEGILASRCVFAVTNGKDMGTIFEAGYAFAKSKPVIYFCEGLPNNGQFNLMLAQSARRVFTSRKELMDCDDVMEPVSYGGLIE